MGVDLEPIAAGVARFKVAKQTETHNILAAVLSLEKGSLASHRSAAFLWGAPVPGDDPVDVTAKRRTAKVPIRNVELHRPIHLAGLRAVLRSGVPTTNPMRTLVDLGAVRADLVAPTLESLLIRGVVSIPAVEHTLAQHRRRGRPGVSALVEALGSLPLTPPADSVLEYEMAKLLHAEGLANWTFHLRVGRFEVDFGFPVERLIIEVDGWAFHAGRFEQDRARDAELVASGWTVLRFTWTQVKQQSTWVREHVRLALAASG